MKENIARIGAIPGGERQTEVPCGQYTHCDVTLHPLIVSGTSGPAYYLAMERIDSPFDCDTAPRSVLIRATDSPSQLTIPPHTHGRSELVFVRSGTVCVTAENRIFMVPSQNAILIPSGTVHDMRMLSDACLLTTYIEMPSDRAGKIGCRSVRVSSLLMELLRAASELPAAYEQSGRDGHIMDLIAEEVAWLMEQPGSMGLQTPAPRDPRLMRICRELLLELDSNWSIDDAARAAGMGRRTFTRIFRQEVGISFSTWRLRARLNAAISRLCAGATVTEVAFESGYNNPSAFATVFKRYLGVSPSNYQTAGSFTRTLHS